MTHDKEKKPHHPCWAWVRKSNSGLRKWKEQFDKRNDWEWFFFFPQSLIVSRLYERPWVSVTNDSVFIEWSNPGSPCCQVHCFSLCSLPIWLSTALQVATTTSPHCYGYNTFWPDLCFTEPWLWTSFKDFTTKSIEDCNDIHNLCVPYSSLWWCISLWVASIKEPQLS